MRIILSRKGFDSSNGGTPSPIMPDGTLLSMPIPDNSSDNELSYQDLIWNGMSYSDLLANLPARKKLDFSQTHCHLDPDLRPDTRKDPVPGWISAFGQTEAAQSVLAHSGVQEGDLFLFFGWFRKTELGNDEKYHYTGGWKDGRDYYDHADLHVIYGYLQIGKILRDPEKIRKYFWHPHANETHLATANNTLYIPAEHLSFAPEKPGYGTLRFSKERVLTLYGKSRAVWQNLEFLRPEKIIYQNRKNSAKSEGLYYAGVWQELAYEGTDEMMEWVHRVLLDEPINEVI